jgi:hypothetical protein
MAPLGQDMLLNQSNHSMKYQCFAPYPDADFLRDFQEWHAYPYGNGDQRAAVVFPKLYPDAEVRSYRLTRLKCVVAAIQTNIEPLVQDKVMLAEDLGDHRTFHLTNRLLLALHRYYGGVDQNKLPELPLPDWTEVLSIYDRIG